MNKFQNTCCVVWLSLMATMLPLSLAQAYDTDIFFSAEQGNPDNHPNVVFILDNSQSMTNTDGTSTQRIDKLKAAMKTVVDNAVDVNVGVVIFEKKSANREKDEQYKPGATSIFKLRSINNPVAKKNLTSKVNGIFAKRATPLVDSLLEATMMLTAGTIDNSAGGAILVDYDHPRANDALEPTDPRVDAEPQATNGFTITHNTSSSTTTEPDGTVTTNYTRTTSKRNNETGATTYSTTYPGKDANGHAHPPPKHKILISTPLAEYPDPIIGQCQPNHIVMLSDGGANGNGVADRVKELIGVENCSATDDEECGLELASWLHNTDHKPGLGVPKNITVHTVSFLTNNKFLPSISNAGGGEHFDAENGEELVDAFQKLLTTVKDADAAYVAPATSISQFNRLSQSKDVFFALFKPKGNATWDGNLKRYQLGLVGDSIAILDANDTPAVDSATGMFRDSARSLWSTGNDGNEVEKGGAAHKMGTGRRIYTHVGPIPGNGATLSVPLDSISAEQLGVNNDQRASLLNWLDGIDSKDENNNGSRTDRRFHMGDPIHSTPTRINYASDKSVVYVGTNEGFLHAIDVSSGTEDYAFIPEQLLGNLGKFYNSVGAYFRPNGLDGEISSLHLDENNNSIVDGADRAYVFAGMRRGGDDYYALDVTNPGNPRLLWRINGGEGDFSKLGQTWSKPIPTQIFYKGSPRHVLIFGGGYDINNDPIDQRNLEPRSNEDSVGNSLYIVDALTGERLWSADAHLNTGGAMKHSIPANLRIIDMDGDNYADRIYVGDMGGQVWRFDIKSYHQSDENESKLVSGGVMARLGSGSNNTPRFYNEPDVALITDGGRKFMSISIGSGWRAAPTDTTNQNRFYMIRDNSPATKPDGYGKLEGSTWMPVTDNDLLNVTGSVGNIPDEHGWMLDLTDNGEKSLSRALTVNNQVIFTSYAPIAPVNVCTPPSGKSFIYSMNVVNGDPALASVTAAPDDRRSVLLTKNIPPAPSAAFVEVNGRVQTGIIVGTETPLNDLPFSKLTQRTYWQDLRRSGMTPARCRAGASRDDICR